MNYAVQERGREIAVTFFITIPPKVFEQSFTINLEFISLTPRKTTNRSIEKEKREVEDMVKEVSAQVKEELKQEILQEMEVIIAQR